MSDSKEKEDAKAKEAKAKEDAKAQKVAEKAAAQAAKAKKKKGFFFERRCKHDGDTYEKGQECKLSGAALEKLCDHGVVKEY